MTLDTLLEKIKTQKELLIDASLVSTQILGLLESLEIEAVPITCQNGQKALSLKFKSPSLNHSTIIFPEHLKNLKLHLVPLSLRMDESLTQSQLQALTDTWRGIWGHNINIELRSGLIVTVKILEFSPDLKNVLPSVGGVAYAEGEIVAEFDHKIHLEDHDYFYAQFSSVIINRFNANCPIGIDLDIL